MKRFLAVFAALTLLLTLPACRQKQPEALPVAAPQDHVYIENNPQKAVDEIYSEITIREVSPLDDSIVRDQLGFDLVDIAEYYGRYSSGRYGLADLYIIRPNEDSYDTVRDQLEQVKYNRIAATENYDILDANKIARAGEVFQYGGYLILLMLDDRERAESILEQYIPSTESSTAGG